MKYEFDQKDAYELARFVNADVRDDGDEIQFQLCPYCHGGGSKDKKTFSINRYTGAFNCLRSSCGHQGHFVTLARDMNYALDFGIAEKEYKRLPQKPVVVRPKAAELLKERGISLDICNRYKLTVQKENQNVVVFPFYNDAGELITVKYRNMRHVKGKGSKEWFEKDTQPILFGMDQAKDFSKPLVITEGQIDALSLAECGVPNACSVPNGCTSFTWVAPCYDWVMKFQSITVMGDCEHGKLTLVEEISKRFRLPVKRVPMESYYGLKDANDILRQYGKETLLDSFNTAQEYMIPHIKRLADVQSIDFSALPRVRTGVQRLDDTLGGFFYGQVILLTGKRGEGKSTFMGQLILEAIDQGNTVLAYSGELTASHFKNWIDFQAAGSSGVVNHGTSEKPMYRIKPDAQERINRWYEPHAYIYDNESVYGEEMEAITETIENAVVRYGINMVCIDNLMTAMDLDAKDDLYQAQSKFVKKLKEIAVRYNIVVLLVAHPRKVKDGEVDNDAVSGSSDITNRVDTVLVYSRANSDDSISRSTLKLYKNRINGKLIIKEPIEMVYSESSKRITPTDQTMQKHYGWENTETETTATWADTLPF